MDAVRLQSAASPRKETKRLQPSKLGEEVTCVHGAHNHSDSTKIYYHCVSPPLNLYFTGKKTTNQRPQVFYQTLIPVKNASSPPKNARNRIHVSAPATSWRKSASASLGPLPVPLRLSVVRSSSKSWWSRRLAASITPKIMLTSPILSTSKPASQ
jgi:hypothetical protein